MIKQLWNAIRQNDTIVQLESERDYLDGRLADFERLTREFVMFKYPDSTFTAPPEVARFSVKLDELMEKAPLKFRISVPHT
jgi:hypothetical protein